MENNNFEAVLQAALNSVKILRTSVGQVFQSLADGIKQEVGEEVKEKKLKIDWQQKLCDVNRNYRDLENTINALVIPSVPINLGNTSHLSHETTLDRTPLYSELVDIYRWTDRVHDYCTMSIPLLSQNPMKRSVNNSGVSNKRRRTQNNSHSVPPQTFDNIINGIVKMFSDMSIVITRPLGTNAVLQISLSKILRAVVICKGLMIEWVMVKGFNEDFMNENGTVDMWSESRYKVFQKLTENANAAMLHFYSPLYPELSIKSFMTWLHSFSTLFTDACRKCGNHFHNNMPPTWRDFRTLEPFHEDCKP